MAFRKTIVYSIAGRQVKLTVANLFSGLVFLVMGLWILAAARGNQLMAYSSFQVSINIYLTGLIRSISRITSLIPEPVWAGVFLLLLFFIVNKAVVQIINLVKKQMTSKEKLILTIVSEVLITVIVVAVIYKRPTGPKPATAGVQTARVIPTNAPMQAQAASMDDHHGAAKPAETTVFDSLLGKTAPDFTLESYDGKK